jgi:(E)-4-hydroxy-3-methylbut-2-enyl-diphosphate synthase
MKITRRKARSIKIGRLFIGANNPIAIQSMTKTKTADIPKTVSQIKALETAGCEIVRLAIKDNADALSIREIKREVHLPLVADIHFNWRLAISAIDNGADKIRLNPGNIYKKSEIKEIVAALKSAGIPLRIGVNSGSVKNLNSRKLNLPDRLVASGLSYIRLVEKFKFYNIVVSLKASGAQETIEAYRKMSQLCDYPFHLGVTATGLPFQGAVKSSIALGVLLAEGIGDTIRVSLTDKPEEEVRAAKAILEALGLRYFGPQIISCPTCGRCEINLVNIVKDLEKKLSTMNYELLTRPPKVAIMGCVVNGPGEAKEADIGVAFGRTQGLLFKNGRAIKKVSFSNCIDTLLKEMEKSRCPRH